MLWLKNSISNLYCPNVDPWQWCFSVSFYMLQVEEATLSVSSSTRDSSPSSVNSATPDTRRKLLKAIGGGLSNLAQGAGLRPRQIWDTWFHGALVFPPFLILSRIPATSPLPIWFLIYQLVSPLKPPYPSASLRHHSRFLLGPLPHPNPPSLCLRLNAHVSLRAYILLLPLLLQMSPGLPTLPLLGHFQNYGYFFTAQNYAFPRTCERVPMTRVLCLYMYLPNIYMWDVVLIQL